MPFLSFPLTKFTVAEENAKSQETSAFKEVNKVFINTSIVQSSNRIQKIRMFTSQV